MNVVGKVGSLISQGVYSVATPFHPFGGAVDVIVVEHEDGTYRSTPWYVRFGKFQGVLKGAEKVVTITVNGVEANFHMYLDNSGQAYFTREVVSGSNDDESRNKVIGELSAVPSSAGSGNYENDGNDQQHGHSDYGLKKEDSVENDAELFRYQDEQASPASSVESSGFNNYQYGSLDEVENMVKETGDANEEMVLISVDGHVLTAPISTNEENADDIQLDTPQFHLGPGEGTSGDFTSSGEMWDHGLFGDLDAPTLKDEESSEHQLPSPKEYEDDSNLKNEETSEHQLQSRGECEDDSTLKDKETSDHQLQSPQKCEDDSALKDEETCDHQLQSPKECEIDSTLKDEETSEHLLQSPRECEDDSIHVEDAENIIQAETENKDRSPKECEIDSTLRDEETSEHLLQSPRECEDDSIHVEDAENIIQDETENKDRSLKKEDMFQSCLDLMSHVQDVEQDISLSKEINQETNQETKQVSPEKHPSIMTASSGTDVKNDLEFRSDELHIITTATAENLKHDSSGDTECKEDADVSQRFVQQVSDISCSASIHSETQEPVTCEERILNAENPAQEVSGASRLHVVDSACEQSISSPMSSCTEDCHQTESTAASKNMFGLGFEISLCGNVLRPGMGRNLAEEAFDSHRISEDVFKASGQSIIKNGNLIVRYRNKYLKWDKASHIIVGKAVFGPEFSVELSDSIEIEYEDITKYRDDASGTSPSSSRRWRLWPIPFRRSSKSLRHTNSDASSEDLFVDSESGFQTPDKEGSAIQSPRKQYARTNIPTNEQVASLKLKEGRNMVTFSFSTRVLGRQQVDAHIYLWKWNARIVISDVDGTITKSDVLGQFMPLVGKDWTQSGVARLFCAIKENGYQLLFLSARAIVQAYLTRSFLLNLKQDGKALPSGPVVISPDGLFPSLYREVIRRAPHEFKIACLEDIKALFPSGYNPFYAGFGNRDTDELSYRKIGIPKGKIFIINPKGEVAINNCVAVKSYTSLHTLVNDMFPPTSLVEQEDFNSWNYWKMPLMEIDA